MTESCRSAAAPWAVAVSILGACTLTVAVLYVGHRWRSPLELSDREGSGGQARELIAEWVPYVKGEMLRDYVMKDVRVYQDSMGNVKWYSFMLPGMPHGLLRKAVDQHWDSAAAVLAARGLTVTRRWTDTYPASLGDSLPCRVTGWWVPEGSSVEVHICEVSTASHITLIDEKDCRVYGVLVTP